MQIACTFAPTANNTIIWVLELAAFVLFRNRFAASNAAARGVPPSA
ncbi:MAG: hypothetical protein JKY19_09225 [Alcanivoracaceae bacterium]|nr:hypothetical protein [Alcanivoracaceae bacterium]